MTTRTRTPSDVKWLVNELAALSGEMLKIDERVAMLAAKREALQSRHAALAHVLQGLRHPSLADVPVESLPVVRANGELGERGCFRNFLREQLQSAFPAALDTYQLLDAVEARFGLTFATLAERHHFRKTRVVLTLRKLCDRGEVVRIHPHVHGTNVLGHWRWNAPAPSLQELEALAGSRPSVQVKAAGQLEEPAWP